MNNMMGTQFEYKQQIKRWLIFLGIAFPFLIVSSCLLVYIKAPLWAMVLCNIVVGGLVVLVEFIVYNKILEKREEKKKDKPKKFDPFSD